jgi:AcrR family transcriptional regulator
MAFVMKRLRKKPADYHHGDLEPALVAAARTILEKDGIEALSLRAVARAVGVSPAAPYHHFADKDALLAAVAAEGFRELTAAMEKRMAREVEPTKRFLGTGAGYVAFAVANPALFRLMFGGSGHRFSTHAGLATAGMASYEVLSKAAGEAVLAVGRDPATVPLTMLTAWSLVHGIAMLVLDAEVAPEGYGVRDPEALATLMLERMSGKDGLAF